MSRIRNSVYGLALGDSIGYPTEFLDWNDTVKAHSEMSNEGFKNLVVTDDTQMSIALIQGVEECLKDHEKKSKEQSPKKLNSFQKAFNDLMGNPSLLHPEDDYLIEHSLVGSEFIPYIGKKFVEWSRSPENTRAPGIATMNALSSAGKPSSLREWLALGTSINSNSKGSGTVMRSPWIGFLASAGIISQENVRTFCHMQSRITHGHATALEGSWLVAELTHKAFIGLLDPRDMLEYSMYLMESNMKTLGNQELWEKLELAHRVSKSYGSLGKYDEDPSRLIGSDGSAETVVATALLIINAFPHDPVEVINRCAVSTGDTDTIGAVAGGIIGAAFEEPLWDESLIEPAYVDRLNQVTDFLEKVNNVS